MGEKGTVAAGEKSAVKNVRFSENLSKTISQS